MGLLGYVICLLINLYAGQEATVRKGNGTTVWFRVGKQYFKAVCSTSLLNLHEGFIIQNARLNETGFEIKFAGTNINNIRYADDMIHVAEHGKNYRVS